jgi:hypothetical protein
MSGKQLKGKWRGDRLLSGLRSTSYKKEVISVRYAIVSNTINNLYH